MATSSLVSEALLREAGIVAVNSVSALFESAILLANQPVPKGRNVVLVSNGGGPGILAADACARNGLKLPELSAATIARIKSVIKRDININNPVDLTAGISAPECEAVLKILAEEDGYDAIITIYVSPSGSDIPAMESAISQAAPKIRENGKPLLVCFVGMRNSRGKMVDGHLVPYYVFPDEAAEALANAVKYSELKTPATGSVPEFPDIERDKARQLIKKILSSGVERPLWLSNQDMSELFGYYGIHFAATAVAQTAEHAVEIARKTGYPVVIKLNSATVTHKTDVGGVVMDVKTPQEVRQAFNGIKTRMEKMGRGNEMQGVAVQRQITEGAEVMVGVSEDPQLGHVILFGEGGILAELKKDTTLCLLPLTDVKASDLINSVKISRVLKGYRSMPAYDIRSLEDLLLRVSAMVEDIPQITEMDLNPVKVQNANQGYWVVDGRIMIR
jgi:acetyltransferase